MDSDKWLEFTIFTGLDKYKSKISGIIKNSKRVKESFEYMRLISLVYTYMEDLVSEIKEIV